MGGRTVCHPKAKGWCFMRWRRFCHPFGGKNEQLCHPKWHFATQGPEIGKISRFFQVIDSNFVAAVQKSKIKQTRHFRRCHCDSAFFCAGSEPHPYARSVMRSACKLASSLTAPTGVARKLRAYLRSLSASAHRSEANAAATRRSRYMPESQ